MRGDRVEKRDADAGTQISTEGERGREEEEAGDVEDEAWCLAANEGRAQGKHNKQPSQNNGRSEHPRSYATRTIAQRWARKLR